MTALSGWNGRKTLATIKGQEEDMLPNPLNHLNYECTDKVSLNILHNYYIVVLERCTVDRLNNLFWKHMGNIGWFWFTAVWMSSAGLPWEAPTIISKVTSKKSLLLISVLYAYYGNQEWENLAVTLSIVFLMGFGIFFKIKIFPNAQHILL